MGETARPEATGGRETQAAAHLRQVGQRHHGVKVRDEDGVNGRDVARDAEAWQQHALDVLRLVHQRLVGEWRGR